MSPADDQKVGSVLPGRVLHYLGDASTYEAHRKICPRLFLNLCQFIAGGVGQKAIELREEGADRPVFRYRYTMNQTDLRRKCTRHRHGGFDHMNAFPFQIEGTQDSANAHM